MCVPTVCIDINVELEISLQKGFVPLCERTSMNGEAQLIQELQDYCTISILETDL